MDYIQDNACEAHHAEKPPDGILTDVVRHRVCAPLRQRLQMFVTCRGDHLRGKNAVVELWHVLRCNLPQ